MSIDVANALARFSAFGGEIPVSSIFPGPYPDPSEFYSIFAGTGPGILVPQPINIIGPHSPDTKHEAQATMPSPSFSET